MVAAEAMPANPATRSLETAGTAGQPVMEAPADRPRAARAVPGARRTLAWAEECLNAGNLSFIGVTVNFTNNEVQGGFGARAGNGGTVKGGNGGNGSAGGPGGDAMGGNGGSGGEAGIGEGGGLFDALSGTLTIKPRLGAKKGSAQAAATNMITGNKAFSSAAGVAGVAGNATVGSGGTPTGGDGVLTHGANGTVDTFTVGVGGGIAIVGTAIIDNTTISDNFASTNDDDVLGTFST